MSIRLGRPPRFDSVVEQIREDDKLFYKIFSRVHNDDMKEASLIVRKLSGFGLMDCRMVIHEIKRVYDEKQMVSLLKYIETHNPEFAI